MKRTALSMALGMCFAGGAQAQSNTAGAIVGHATAGETVTITNPNTGFTRSATVSGDGSYRFSALPTGQYTVTTSGGASRSVVVNVGTATTADFATGEAATLDTVTVIGNAINPIDVSSVESTTIMTAEQIARIPVARDATSVALLAPGTVRGDAAFGNLASFGGSSVAENQYYVNGFNITNSFRSLNFSAVPFEAIAEQQVKTGGYGAEFGRSLGGVINQITKRGSNEFHAGGNIFYTPESLYEHPKDTYYSNPLTPEYGELRADNSHDETWGGRASVWASGALIKDKLFAYGLLSFGKDEVTNFGSHLATTNTTAKTESPNWLLKLDWHITDNHLLEFTGFSDDSETKTYAYDNEQGQFERTGYNGYTVTESGGNNYILKYTGYLTDTFTLSALAGQNDYSRSSYVVSPDGRKAFYDGTFTVPTPEVAPTGGCPVVIDSRPGYRQAITGPYASTCNVSGGTLQDINSGDERKQFRLDAEWQLGDHLLRFGYDQDDYESRAGSAREGGYQWTYLTSNGDDETPNTGDEYDLARLQYTSQGATVKVKQHAFYIEDSWNVTDNFIAYIGGRWDTFENINGQGETYVKINNQFGPRLGFSWDVNGDSTFKVFGNAGRYALPLTPSVAVRGASASLFTREDFIPETGSVFMIDPTTGAPTNAVSTGNFRFINAETGNPKLAETIASKNLDPMYQDEFILGAQAALTDNFSLGVRGIYRELKAAIDDNCDYTAVLNSPGSGFTFDPDEGWWFDANGNAANLPNEGFPYCRMFNPGEDAVFVTDFLGDGNLTEVTVPGELLSPKAKRSYGAIEFFWEGHWDKWWLQGSYTFAKSKGNTEGGVKSDIGQNDTNVTQDFDYLELTTDTYGYLPNDRRHSLKLFGRYEFNDEWSVGANLLVQSGRPINCFGVLDLDPVPSGVDTVNQDGDPIPDGIPDANYSPHPYGSSFMQCSPSGDARTNDSVAVPRGTKGRLPWTNSVDLSVRYAPSWAQGLQFKVDVFNVFDQQKVTSVIETAEVSATGAASATYLLPASFQTPRHVRLMVQYDF
ncbi:TonB-dependent receptor [Pseudoxanthomonas sangjuensis]|uniref:TonB-dependent receptor n=1 Tax=Pseudoxanthomonas sangjuensis TaxID=1503750 RepID=UPI001390CF83|nr:TonB-dependent receptor [Pseudoxanthomonas sangjuensis]